MLTLECHGEKYEITEIRCLSLETDQEHVCLEHREGEACCTCFFWIIIDAVVSGVFVAEAVCRRWDYHSVELRSEAGDFIRSMSVKCTI